MGCELHRDSDGELMDLIVAANFLLIQPLLDVAFGVVGGSES